MDFKFICILFILFFVYSFIGWCMEVVVTLYTTKKLVNRGFLVGPICPIYGFGGTLMALTLSRYSEDPFVVFGMAILICTVLEYFTSYIMEKMFKARWWDYSDHKFNLNGRVCLENIIAFGVLALAMIYFIYPILSNFFDSFNEKLIYIISAVLLVVGLSDLILSYTTISGFKKIVTSNVKQDNTEEITKRVRKALQSKTGFVGHLYKRLVSSYATWQASESLIVSIPKRVIEAATKVSNAAIDTVNKTTKAINENVNKTGEAINRNIKKVNKEITKSLNNRKKK